MRAKVRLLSGLQARLILCQRLDALPRGFRELPPVLFRSFAGDFRRALTNLLGEALIKRFASDNARLLFQLVRELAESLVLHVSAGDEHPGQETNGDRANRESDRILLCHAYRLPRLPFHLLSVRQGIAHA